MKTYVLARDPVLAEMVSRLVATLHPQRVYLFGSQARGDAGSDSDCDMMVVIEHADEPAYRLAQRPHSLIWELGTAVDSLVWTRERFDSRLHLDASLPTTILREGRLLYAA